jgi:hypothetical protein
VVEYAGGSIMIGNGIRIKGLVGNNIVSGKIIGTKIMSNELMYTVLLDTPVQFRWRDEPVNTVLMSNDDIQVAVC